MIQVRKDLKIFKGHDRWFRPSLRQTPMILGMSFSRLHSLGYIQVMLYLMDVLILTAFKYLLSAYNIPDAILSGEDNEVNKTSSFSSVS